MIFSLPFHLPRYYGPTGLEVLGLSNADLGEACVCFGITAVSGNFPGGNLVDHLLARKLMTTWPVATAVRGRCLMGFSDFTDRAVLQALWGVAPLRCSGGCSSGRRGRGVVRFCEGVDLAC